MKRSTNAGELLRGRKYAPRCLGSVLIVGLGKSGMAAVRYCASLLEARVTELVVSAGKRTPAAEAFVAEFADKNIEFRFEYEAFEREFDLCIMSPGVPEISALYKNAKRASAELVSEIEFAWRESDVRSTWVAITGTNGKTTTTSLVEHICMGAGIRAHAVGNIGEVALTCVAENPQDVYVCEISSFQLASVSRFAPDVAVLLNITPDHIYWHGSMERYVQAKRNILANIGTHTTVIADCSNDETAHVIDTTMPYRAYRRCICLNPSMPFLASLQERAGNFATVADGNLCIWLDEPALSFPAEKLQIKGQHNEINALAAASAALALGVSPEAVCAALSSFAPLEHRIEPCGTYNGVAYFNDSKATNVDSTCKAFTAFEAGKVICLLGGHDKGTDLTPLVADARRTCKAVVCYGEAKDIFVKAFAAFDAAVSHKPGERACEVLEAPGMRDAARKASSIAAPGDVVLLSPACASFDEFTCFEERGEIFKALVKAEFGAHDKQ